MGGCLKRETGWEDEEGFDWENMTKTIVSPERFIYRKE
jgi:hypothetical protein